jgi:hypothetical protein
MFDGEKGVVVWFFMWLTVCVYVSNKCGFVFIVW